MGMSIVLYRHRWYTPKGHGPTTKKSCLDRFFCFDPIDCKLGNYAWGRDRSVHVRVRQTDAIWSHPIVIKHSKDSCSEFRKRATETTRHLQQPRTDKKGSMDQVKHIQLLELVVWRCWGKFLKKHLTMNWTIIWTRRPSSRSSTRSMPRCTSQASMTVRMNWSSTRGLPTSSVHVALVARMKLSASIELGPQENQLHPLSLHQNSRRRLLIGLAAGQPRHTFGCDNLGRTFRSGAGQRPCIDWLV
jgi:hypothetical protein